MPRGKGGLFSLHVKYHLEHFLFLTTLGSHSVLTGNRRDWNERSLELLCRLRRDFIVGGRTDIRQRSNDTDDLYITLLSFTPIRPLEAHGSVTLVPAAHFSAEQIYAAGLEWRAVPQISLLFDYERLHLEEARLTGTHSLSVFCYSVGLCPTSCQPALVAARRAASNLKSRPGPLSDGSCVAIVATSGPQTGRNHFNRYIARSVNNLDIVVIVVVVQQRACSW